MLLFIFQSDSHNTETLIKQTKHAQREHVFVLVQNEKDKYSRTA